MENTTEMYTEEITPSNEIKGFTKSFVKRTKAKKTEDIKVKELLNFQKENRVQAGAKVTEKNFKNNIVEKVFVASNCDVLTLKKIKHYAKIADVDIVELDLDNGELSQKMGKPFLISMVCVRKNKNE